MGSFWPRASAILTDSQLPGVSVPLAHERSGRNLVHAPARGKADPHPRDQDASSRACARTVGHELSRA